MDYITEADVDDLLGMGWDDSPQEGRSVMLANAWLRQHLRGEVATDPVPQAIRQAGAEIAREAGKGRLYAASGREVTSQSVSAGDGVAVSKTFAAGSAARTAGEAVALALIAPWRRRGGVFTLHRA